MINITEFNKGLKKDSSHEIIGYDMRYCVLVLSHLSQNCDQWQLVLHIDGVTY